MDDGGLGAAEGVSVGAAGLFAALTTAFASFLTWLGAKRKDSGALALELVQELRSEVQTLRDANADLRKIADEAKHAAANLMAAVDGLLLAFDLPAEHRAPIIEKAKAARAKASRTRDVGE